MWEESIQETFEEIYELLVKLSNQIEKIQKTSYELTLMLTESLPSSWNQFIDYFNLGVYFHHRCQGYVECLRVTNAYTPVSIEVWIHELVYPAADHFMQAKQLLNEIKEIPAFHGSGSLSRFEEQMVDFQETAMMIINYTKRLDSTLLY